MKNCKILTVGVYIIVIALVGIACSGRETEAVAIATPAPVTWQTEAYIDLTPAPKPTPTPRNTYSPLQWNTSVGQPRDAHESTPGPNSANVTLETAQFGKLTLYKIQGTDYYIVKPEAEEVNTKIALQNCAAFLNNLASENAGVKVYSYFINRASNCDWYSETNGLYVYDYAGYFEQVLGADTRVKTGQYVLRDIQDYMDTGYKTDFHVNYKGSYRVYQDIYRMLSENMSLSQMLVPVRELDFNGLKMMGDLFDEEAYKASGISEAGMDDFKAYAFDYAPYVSYLNDKQTVLGLEAEYEAGEISRDPRFGHQFLYYGGQTGVIRYEFNRPELPNLLILADSQGRPSRLQIASHFNRTVFLDDVQARKLDIGRIIAEYSIDVVIFMGQRSMFEFYE